MGKHAEFHPTKAMEGEKLPNGFVHNCSGFLVDTNICEVKVNQTIVKRDSIHLQKYAIMASFIGGKQSTQVIMQWISTLQAEAVA
jgi:hypothetical protein